jgi:uncharacterized protein YndB with AHSA1/START domain
MMWKWIALIVAVPLVLAAIVYGVGALLPRDHVARVDALLAAPPAAAAALIRDVEAQPRWRSSVKSIEVLERAAGRLRYVEHGGEDIAFEFREETPGSRFRSTIADPSLPFGGAWTIELAPQGAGTRVSIEERGEVRDPLYRFFSRFVFGHEATIRTYLADLERALQHP